jgi:hypothetical protein
VASAEAKLVRGLLRLAAPCVLILSAVTLCVAWPAVARAQTLNPGASGRAPEQVVLSGTVAVPKGTTVGEVVVFHGRALISGSVHGDVVVLDGPITIDGAYVTGSVVALRGTIHVTGTSLIGGDVLGGGHVVVDRGAKVGRQVREHVGFTLQGPLAALGILLGSVALAVSVLLLGLLLLLIAPRGADRLATAATTAPLASLGWGLLVAIVLPVLCIVATASIVGLPLGLAGLLALALLFLTGLAWTAWAIGRAILPAPRARVLAFVVGWAIVAAAGLVPFVNIGVWGLGSAFGIGTLTVAVWRSRRAGRTGRHRVGGGGFLPEPPVTLPAAAEEEPVSSYPSTSDD